jgi:hypothetical protein
MNNLKMPNFAQYVEQLEKLATCQAKEFHLKSKFIKAALNGEAARQLRSSVSVEICRKNGMFFTGDNLSTQLTKRFLPGKNRNVVIADPACGSGNLLIACAKRLPIGDDLEETLHIWGEALVGYDICSEFIRAAKARLLILAKKRTNKESFSKPNNIDSYFPQIYVKDFIKDPSSIRQATHLVINPPYNKISRPRDYEHAQGESVSAASVFIDYCLKYSEKGTKLAAILPDVLRTGSFCERLRESIKQRTTYYETEVVGQFDKWTDVDVFILRAEIGKPVQAQIQDGWKKCKSSGNFIKDYFDVHVGPVVPHRDSFEGKKVAYIHAKSVPSWGTVKRINEFVPYSGKVFTPPFVVVRRTSRPGPQRAIATIITRNRPVAIENHLIILLPKNKELSTCIEVLRLLKTKKTDSWLNKNICCRHLTVSSIKEIPFATE